MSKIATKFLVLVLVFNSLSGILFAQSATSVNQQYENLLQEAENTIDINSSGQISQIEIHSDIDFTNEVVQLGYDGNGLSSVTVSNGDVIGIQRNWNGEVVGFIFPDGGNASINWSNCESSDPPIIDFTVTSDKWAESILFSDTSISSLSPRTRNSVCRDAAVDAALAFGLCTVTGGASIPCYYATARAAYSAYRCWESTR